MPYEQILNADFDLRLRPPVARAVSVPRDEADLDRALAGEAFTPDPPRGVLLTAPLRQGDGRPQPKLGVCFVAPTRAEVLAVEGRFRARLER